MSVLIVTEANETVASGHLMESIALYKELNKNDVGAHILYNSDMPKVWSSLLSEINCSGFFKSVEEGMPDIVNHLKQNNYDVLVTDLREIKNEQLKEIKKVFLGRIICLDEWGNRFLECDTIVNNMADESFWDYKNSSADICFGPQYLMLPEKLGLYHEKEKFISDSVKNVVVSMGGVDKFNNTKKIVEELKPLSYIERVNVVLGGGYKWEDEIRDSVEKDLRFRIHKNIGYIFELFYEADLAFSAGGNTMYELAAIGTPTIVVPTMEHERINGKAFEKKGFSHVVKVDEIFEMIDRLSKKNRLQESQSGKNMVDGKGLERICALVMEMGNNDRF